MATLCKKAGVKYFRYHALRHLTASTLDDLGAHIGTTQRILGHQNRRTTEIYLHSVGEAERDAISKLESNSYRAAKSRMRAHRPTYISRIGIGRRKDLRMKN